MIHEFTAEELALYECIIASLQARYAADGDDTVSASIRRLEDGQWFIEAECAGSRIRGRHYEAEFDIESSLESTPLAALVAMTRVLGLRPDGTAPTAESQHHVLASLAQELASAAEIIGLPLRATPDDAHDTAAARDKAAVLGIYARLCDALAKIDGEAT